ncbi:hypothetical protein M9H77_28388 [Catharanthus roseus]|uniref:Uncharacterized protein n=1 Tax=Catharanthus roseus TaxID=4058 RepID=A0ACC0AGV3_CATRO|nr:hypothetical protein M9H77_28388 [Catharanthus roseus]
MCVVISSVAEPLDVLPLLHYVFGDRVDRIYRVQLTRNGIISVRSVNLIIIVIEVLYNIDGSSETIRVTAVICSGKVVVFLSFILGIFCCSIGSNSTRI